MPLPDADSLSSYGGEKADYEVAVVDETTDLGAAQWNALAATVADGSRMFPRCSGVFTGHGSAPVFVSFEAVWKGNSGTAPTMARSGSGVFTATFPSSVNDALGDAHTLNLTRAKAWAEGSTAYHCQASAAANVVTIRVFDMAGATNDAVGVTLVFEAR